MRVFHAGWTAMMRKAIAQDFSWSKAAVAYGAVYERVLARPADAASRRA